MGIKINIPIGTRVKIVKNDYDLETEECLIGKITNIFNGLVHSDWDYDDEPVAGLFIETSDKKQQDCNILRCDKIFAIDKNNEVLFEY